MRKVVLLASITLLTISFSGCLMSRGNDAITKQENINQIRVYKSTKDEVRSILGEPDNVVALSGGRERWIYTHTDANFSILNYYKIGLTGSGSNMIKTKSTMLTLTFNSKGILISKKVGY